MNSEMASTHFDNAWGRVKLITGWTDYKDLAGFVGSSSQSISGVKKRGKFPLEWARKIATSFSSFTDYIMDGYGPSKRDEAAYSLAEDLKTAGYVQVPRYELAASAGGGAIVHSEQIVDHLTFKADWVHNALGVPVSKLALINVRGDSMEPTLSEGDVILIDMSTSSIEDNAIYVLRFNGVLLVKRIQRKLDGTVVVKGDNPVYEPEVIKGDLVETLNVVGRVVWCGRRM